MRFTVITTFAGPHTLPKRGALNQQPRVYELKIKLKKLLYVFIRKFINCRFPLASPYNRPLRPRG